MIPDDLFRTSFMSHGACSDVYYLIYQQQSTMKRSLLFKISFFSSASTLGEHGPLTWVFFYFISLYLPRFLCSSRSLTLVYSRIFPWHPPHLHSLFLGDMGDLLYSHSSTLHLYNNLQILHLYPWFP